MSARFVAGLTVSVAASLLLVSPPAFAGVEETCVAAANESESLRKDVTKLTKAREKLRACAADECPGPIRDECRKSLGEVEAQIPTVVLVAEDGQGQKTFDVTVRVDGAPLVSKLDGSPVTVDAGAHTFTFQREGGASVDVRAVLVAGQKNTEVVARFPAPPGAPKAPDVVPPPRAAEPIGPKQEASMLPTVGLIIAGAGVVGLGLGTVFGIVASGKQSDSRCDGTKCPDETSKGKLDDAISAATTSTVFFIAGGALLAGGLTLYFVAPKTSSGSGSSAASARLRPVVGPNGAALMFEGVAF